MNRRTALLAPLAALIVALPAQAEVMALQDLSAYLNGIRTAQTRFTQINADETISTGMIYIQRPGRMRFEYDPPDAGLVLASGGTVAIFDAKSNEPPEQYPLARTPLNLILQANVDLARARMVTAHQQIGDATQVVAQDPDHPEYGSLAMMFTANPTALRQWIVTDDLGQQTTLVLGDLTLGADYPPSHFAIESELRRRGLSR